MSQLGDEALGFYVIFIFIEALFALPWIVNNSLKFSARMTSYRNVRLNWRNMVRHFSFIIRTVIKHYFPRFINSLGCQILL